jgi:CBS-domain-containing membrane protein
MSSFDLVAIVPLELTTFAIVVVVGVIALRALQARRRPKRRVVEQPNSHYTSQLARDNETRHRWSNIALDRMHEVNRGEVERLLAKVEATSVDALRPNEREFLDRMAELADARPPAGPGGKERQGAPDLRHRPA